MPKSGQLWDPECVRNSPLFLPFARWTAPLAERAGWPTCDDYTAWAEQSRLEAAPHLAPLAFAQSRPRPRRFRRTEVRLEELYDGSIARLSKVPCVAQSYHDLWNAIAFAAFPRAKRALHARQYRALTAWAAPGAARLPERRTREQDALTVFDEGGTVLLLNAATAARWRNAVAPIELPRVADLLLFGHALMEHVCYGQFALRSCAVVLPWESETAPELSYIDEQLELRLRDDAWFQSPGADGVVVLDEAGRMWVEPATQRGDQPPQQRIAPRP